MAGRYDTTEVIDGNHYATWRNPVDPMGPGILDGVATFEHVLAAGERLDTLAARYLGDDRLYWVLALCNDIVDPFDIAPGLTLRIPRDIRRVLSRLSR